MDLICSTVKLTCENKTNRGNKMAKRKKHHHSIDMAQNASIEITPLILQSACNEFGSQEGRRIHRIVKILELNLFVER